MKRRELRECIFQLLFRVEFNGQEEMPKQLLMFVDDIKEENEAQEEDEAYISGKYEKIMEKLPEIDAMLEKVSRGWKLSRMGKVELTILRLAVYEMRFNEAVELSKKFGGDDSPAFINGVLAKLTGQ